MRVPSLRSKVFGARLAVIRCGQSLVGNRRLGDCATPSMAGRGAVLEWSAGR
jgi:hypothetical protein